MTLIKYRPIRETRETLTPRTFSDIMDNFFDEALTNTRLSGSFVPTLDVTETEKEYSIEVTLPGMKKNEIKVDLEDNRLTISGERKHGKEEKNKKYHLVESSYGTFTRSLALPNNIKRDSINARFEDGILKIGIEKDANSVTKSIQVK